MRTLFVLLLSVSFFAADAQYTRHIIRFTDKAGSSSSINNPSAYLSPKSILRRSRQLIVIDSTDLPVSKSYIDSIRAIQNVQVLSYSKWLNQVLIQCSDPSALTKIGSYPFVQTISVIAPVALPGGEEFVNKTFNEQITVLPARVPLYGTRKYNEVHDEISYGSSFDQVHIHEGEHLHNLGYRGTGVTIAVFDAGFNNVPTNPAFDSLRLQGRILGGYDFVTNSPGISLANSHGMNCLSVLAANRPGVFVGTAPNASYWLLRTEDDGSEFPIEEHYWAIAAEFADSAGVDMISSSLGYTSFDDPALNHSYSDRNGNICISTIAADLAARKGIIVMNSAGNNGGQANDERYVSCPADGDSVVAVGAIRTDKTIAAFSSWGPNGAGKVKPDFVSIGQGTIVANASGNPAAANGTSFSNPNLAGLFACLWQAFPDFTNMEIIGVVRKSSDRFMNPDIRYGYGIPNFRIAFDLLSQERARRNSEAILDKDWIKAYPVPFDNNLTIIIKAPTNGKAQVRITDILGRTLQIQSLSVLQNEVYFVRFSSLSNYAKGMYLIQYIDQQTRKTIKVIAK